jgi:Phosphoglucose isomerase
MIRLLTPHLFFAMAFVLCSLCCIIPQVAAFTSGSSPRHNRWAKRWGDTTTQLRIASEDVDQNRVQDKDAVQDVIEIDIPYDDLHHLSNDHHNFDGMFMDDHGESMEMEEHTLNLRIQLPERLAPGVGWKHHHEATLRLFRGNGDVDEDQDDDQANEAPEPEKQHGGNPVSNFFKHYIMRPHLVSSTPEWKRLQKHAKEIKKTHLRDMLQDQQRCDTFFLQEDGVYVDYSRQRANLETMELLFQLAEKQDLRGKIQSMVQGEKINFTEKRAVLHTALRADKSQIGTVFVDGIDAIREVHEVLDDIKYFTDGVRSGTIRGCTGKRLRNIVSVGIGGSYLGPEFLHESLKTEPEGINAALGYSLRFLSNVDPVDVERTCADLDPEETLIVIVSKTFTTSETMLNARTMRQWLWDFMGNDKEVVMKHVVACASISSIDKVAEFGIDTENYFFRFWDWVGGRYSVCSAAGAVPISLLYGYDLFEKFLQVSFVRIRIRKLFRTVAHTPLLLAGRSVDGSTLFECSIREEHSCDFGPPRGVEHVLPWLQYTCDTTIWTSSVEATRSYSTIGYGIEWKMYDKAQHRSRLPSR